MQGLPFSAVAEDVATLFQGYSLGVDARPIRMLARRDGRPSGDALVMLSDEYTVRESSIRCKSKLAFHNCA